MLTKYFEYIEHLLDTNSRITFKEKCDMRNIISFFKVSGYVDVIDIHISQYENYDLDNQLYILFEYLSLKLFKLKTYSNWLKNEK